MRKPYFVACNQQRRRPSFASLKSDKWLWYSKPLEIRIHVADMPNANGYYSNWTDNVSAQADLSITR